MWKCILIKCAKDCLISAAVIGCVAAVFMTGAYILEGIASWLGTNYAIGTFVGGIFVAINLMVAIDQCHRDVR